jgi:predicted Ser/Thr protein kinase
MCDEEYKYIKVLGKGAQGVVCLYEEVATGLMWAIKFDPKGQADSTLLTESTFLKIYSPEKDRLPKYKTHGKIEGRRFLIMENLEHSL